MKVIKMKVAVCFSGHLRTFDKCYDNIVENIFTPLKNKGYEIDVYCSTWKTIGHRTNHDIDQSLADISVLDKLYTKQIDIEPENQEYFRKEFYTPNWDRIYCIESTCGDNASELYKIKRCYDMVISSGITYDMIMRLRFDVMYEKPIPIPDVLEDCIYMPYGKIAYSNISLYMMNQIVFGKVECMREYFCAFDNIKRFIANNITPLNSEGFLYNSINTRIVRFDLSFYMQRKYGRCKEWTDIQFDQFRYLKQ
jgi:hypothetical protein